MHRTPVHCSNKNPEFEQDEVFIGGWLGLATEYNSNFLGGFFVIYGDNAQFLKKYSGKDERFDRLVSEWLKNKKLHNDDLFGELFIPKKPK